jgi:RsiW-degrading membrane proteinase PrsW (M82 family)
VQLNTKVADSLILAIFNLCLALSGIDLLRSSHSAWIIDVCWILLPPLFVVTVFFWKRDLSKPEMRKQAFAAFLISAPVLTLEIWFIAQLKL